jgi:hypothetical protein
MFAPYHQFPDQHVQIGKSVPEPFRSSLKQVLKDNADVFAWTPSDMVGVPRELSEHRLNVSKTKTPVAQKKRTMGPEQIWAVIEEVEKLKQAGILREVKYQTWIANPVLVRKHDVGWRMCVDFKNLSDACPKDCYPLPSIDVKVDSLDPF